MCWWLSSPFGAPPAATAQDTAASKAEFSGWSSQPRGAEGSWLYTAKIPGYTFQGLETYSEKLLDRPAWEQAGTTQPIPPAAEIAPGEQLGPYRIEARIGAGGMGDVYRARDTRLNRQVAIKVSAAQFTERFGREANAIAALNHPNICQIYDIGPNYIVMEFVDGSPIVPPEQHENPPMSPSEALALALQIAAALEAAHAKGIIHRDLKPANILATPVGQVKLLDFGLAKQTHASDWAHDTAETMRLTQLGMIMGTPAYMSPEQAEGRAVDGRSDIFSFGAVLYEMLAGRRAFSGSSIASTLGAILHKTPEPLNAPAALQAGFENWGALLKGVHTMNDAHTEIQSNRYFSLQNLNFSSLTL